MVRVLIDWRGFQGDAWKAVDGEYSADYDDELSCTCGPLHGLHGPIAYTVLLMRMSHPMFPTRFSVDMGGRVRCSHTDDEEGATEGAWWRLQVRTSCPPGLAASLPCCLHHLAACIIGSQVMHTPVAVR